MVRASSAMSSKPGALSSYRILLSSLLVPSTRGSASAEVTFGGSRSRRRPAHLVSWKRARQLCFRRGPDSRAESLASKRNAR